MKKETKKIREFEKWLKKEGVKNWGTRCKKFAMMCTSCHFWEIYDHIKILADNYEELDGMVMKKPKRMKDKG